MAEGKDLLQVLWNGADVLRGKMDANEYKTYLLGLVFYKYLSDSYLAKAYDFLYDKIPESTEEAQKAYEEAMTDEDVADLLEELQETMHYVLEPDMTYISMLKDVKENCFNREKLQAAFNRIEESDELFNGLFSDVDLYSNRLGTGDQKQSATIADVLAVLADAYEFLIGQFASETGKKAGEFYTPHGPAQLLCQIAMLGQENKKGLLVYDPCMGSASLMLSCKNYSQQPEYIHYYGQELMPSTYNLARMNMFLHRIQPENQHLRNADTLDADWPVDVDTGMDVVVMNPPYSAKWSAAEGFKQDERFMDYEGKLAPKSKADYAFLLHGFYHLKNAKSSTMAIVLPHGVLFRGAAEGVIRKTLLKNGSIYAVIGLPSNMFYNTSIPTCIIVLKKQREGRDVLFIDASKHFVKEKKQNIMNEEHIQYVLDLYKNRKPVEKEAYLASFDEIAENDFNLNIPRYVDTIEEEPPVDLKALTKNIRETDKAIKKGNSELLSMLNDLTFNNTETKEAVEEFIHVLEEV